MMPSKVISEKQIIEVRKALKSSFVAMHYMGMSKQEVMAEIEKIYDELSKEEE